MARGRMRRYGVPPKPFDEAFPLIDKLETAVVRAMVEPAFTANEALLAMYGEETVAKLKAAWPLTRDSDRSRFAQERFAIPAAGATAITATVTVDVKAAGMLVPIAGVAKPDRVLHFTPLVKAIQEVAERHWDFEKLRRAVRWLNDHGTPGAARHYCPWLTALLPEDHAYQKVDGLMYREPAVGMAEIMPTMRECAAIMAAAIMCPIREDMGNNHFNVCIHGQRQGAGYQSNPFVLI
jgi:hypothetical protein